MSSSSVSSKHGGPARLSMPCSHWHMVRHFPSFSIHIATVNTFVKDTSAFLIIIYSARHRGLMRAHGVKSLLDKIVEDATVYFLIIFISQLLVVFFQFLAPVSDHLADLCSSTHGKLHIGNDPTPSHEVSRHFEHHNTDQLDEMLSCL